MIKETTSLKVLLEYKIINKTQFDLLFSLPNKELIENILEERKNKGIHLNQEKINQWIENYSQISGGVKKTENVKIKDKDKLSEFDNPNIVTRILIITGILIIILGVFYNSSESIRIILLGILILVGGVINSTEKKQEHEYVEKKELQTQITEVSKINTKNLVVKKDSKHSGIVQCPYCKEEIKEFAKKCRHCGEWLHNESHKSEISNTSSSSSFLWLLFIIGIFILVFGTDRIYSAICAFGGKLIFGIHNYGNEVYFYSVVISYVINAGLLVLINYLLLKLFQLIPISSHRLGKKILGIITLCRVIFGIYSIWYLNNIYESISFIEQCAYTIAKGILLLFVYIRIKKSE